MDKHDEHGTGAAIELPFALEADVQLLCVEFTEKIKKAGEVYGLQLTTLVSIEAHKQIPDLGGQ